MITLSEVSRQRKTWVPVHRCSKDTVTDRAPHNAVLGGRERINCPDNGGGGTMCIFVEV